MTLMDIYIDEVTKRLHKNKREEVRLELKASIEAMLPQEYSEAEVKAALKKLGSPVEVAASYQKIPRFFMSVNVYDQYIRTLKLAIPWAIFITIVVQIIEKVMLYTGNEALLSAVISAFTMTIIAIFSVLFHVLFWITVIFLVIDRFGKDTIQLPFIPNTKQWTPEDLADIKIIPKEKVISLSEAIFSLIGIAIFSFVYWNANRLLGIYTTNDNGSLKYVMPIFNQHVLFLFAPIILCCILLSLILVFLKWRTGQWTMPIAIMNALLQILGTIVFILIAIHPDILHSAAIPYIAAIIETTSAKVTFTIDKILLVSIIITVLANAFDIYQGFKKAKS
ncbi:hypothetical protein I6G82_19360 [Lysinibacillus macroides]|uniref:Uncharacterized protein n=1 Tax=Lysinibacillus macroides TaxID=33935 RepID=A0A0M9DH48_9BACI|nr:hypothetical protein [Lysinibacillus macroides]KOY80062.1 hypothetical protein ADM90_22915 [Lysinibacillus macroides]QPR67350.1 hypothetical protein I6G82_19360 [Lysinibacillus macroides]